MCEGSFWVKLCVVRTLQTACDYWHTSPTNKNKNLESFLGIMKNIGRFSPANTWVCKPQFSLLTSAKAEWTCNSIYQELYEKCEGYNQRCCMHEVLKWQRTPLIRNICIRCRIRVRSSTSLGWFEVLTRWSTWQHSIVSWNICKH